MCIDTRMLTYQLDAVDKAIPLARYRDGNSSLISAHTCGPLQTMLAQSHLNRPQGFYVPGNGVTPDEEGGKADQSNTSLWCTCGISLIQAEVSN